MDFAFMYTRRVADAKAEGERRKGAGINESRTVKRDRRFTGKFRREFGAALMHRAPNQPASQPANSRARFAPELVG